jgi:hypothetical protein
MSTGLPLQDPVIWGAVAAGVVVVVAGVVAWQMSNGLKFKWWVIGPVYGGPAWTAKDSWVTNIAGVGALLGTVITDSGTGLKNANIPSASLEGVTLLFIIFGGIAAAAPIIYGATAKVESQGITNTTGRVWGFLLAGAASLLAVLGEMATLGLLVWTLSSSGSVRASIIVLLSIGAAAIAAYSLRSLMYFATLPAPHPDPSSGAGLAVSRSLLGNTSFSATL